MDLFSAFILGVVEGLTEFLPVSSTGHLILVGHWLRGASGEAEKAFDVVIQGGAILAVVWNYRKLLKEKTLPLLKRDPAAIRFWWMLFIAFLPAAILGLSFHSKIKAYLFGVEPVLWALAVGGLLMIVVERLKSKMNTQSVVVEDWSAFSLKKAFGVGLFQCLALWPGTSRSMSTIVGARILGLNHVQAAEFSFLLSIPTLLAATFYDLFKNWQAFSEAGMWGALVIGFVTSYIVALVVIRVFLDFLKKYGLESFGWYRIFLSALIAYVFFY